MRDTVPTPRIRRQLQHEIPWVDRINPDNRLLGDRGYRIAKRIMDLGLVLVSAPLWVPLFFLCVLLITIESPGDPIFFAQERTGHSGHRFRMLKFRTMVPNAEEMKSELMHLSKLEWPDFKIDNDPRITKVGHWLRKTSLDELPQLINILRDEMSLVGPRPTSFGSERYSLWQTQRLDVLPGLTGLWQIVARSEIEFYERARLDIIYIEKRCLWLDIQILVRTIPAVLKGEGAR